MPASATAIFICRRGRGGLHAPDISTSQWQIIPLEKPNAPGLMEAAKPVLARQEVNRRIAENKRPANAIWLWEGPAPSMPFMDMHIPERGHDLSCGSPPGNCLCGNEVIEFWATGTIETNYRARLGAIDAPLRHDSSGLHIGPDEAGHAGDLEEDQGDRASRPEGGGPGGRELDKRMGLAHSPPARSCHPNPQDPQQRPVPFVIAGKGIEPDGVED